MLYKGWFTVCECYSWGMALNVGLGASFDNTKNWKGIDKKVRQINNKKSYVTKYEISHCILKG
jgi:hypothetical protein